MAKDTEKLIRQLSLISYLMAERRPVTALEIRRDVEGYSGMNEDAFARRFYADRSELESLRIQLTVERPVLQDYLRRLFENDKLKIVPRGRKTDSVELNSGEDFLGVISADDPKGRSFTLQIAILDFDLEEL